MNSVFLTGSTGFVGTSFLNYFKGEIVRVSSRGNECNINDAKIVIHLAGKAHDLKKTSNSDEYYQVNTDLTKKVFDAFLESSAIIFITLSSVKAVSDEVHGELTEEYIASPITHYGKSKLLAEKYILSKQIPKGKKVYILRPCMIHGPGNKGNLNLLYKLVSKAIPWPLGKFENKRSYCSIENLFFIINELIVNEKIASGIYNVADDEALSTNEIIRMIAEQHGRKAYILKIPNYIVKILSKLGDLFKLSFNTERLNKLTQNYVVSNKKIKLAINKPLPVTATVGLMKTINSFGKNNAH
jgi:nucleoside-diphosphate-sugar epimerase